MCVLSQCCRVVSSLGLILQVHFRYRASSWYNCNILITVFQKGVIKFGLYFNKSSVPRGILTCTFKPP
jgi:hypothetical protein